MASTDSSASSAILLDNPKAENESWETWGERLAEKYKTPAATPNLPLVPGFDKLPETWSEYGTQWKDYYNTKVAGKPIQTTNGPTLPPLPTTEASGAEWAAWGKAVGEAWTAFAASKGIDLVEITKDLKYPEEPTNGDWSAYPAQWNEYGKEVRARFEAALASKSA